MKINLFKYSFVTLSLGLSLWYASPAYFYEQKPHELIVNMYNKGIIKEFEEDIHVHAFPMGIFTRPMTYVGLAGLVASFLIPKKKDD